MPSSLSLSFWNPQKCHHLTEFLYIYSIEWKTQTLNLHIPCFSMNISIFAINLSFFLLTKMLALCNKFSLCIISGEDKYLLLYAWLYVNAIQLYLIIPVIGMAGYRDLWQCLLFFTSYSVKSATIRCTFIATIFSGSTGK